MKSLAETMTHRPELYQISTSHSGAQWLQSNHSYLHETDQFSRTFQNSQKLQL